MLKLFITSDEQISKWCIEQNKTNTLVVDSDASVTDFINEIEQLSLFSTVSEVAIINPSWINKITAEQIKKINQNDKTVTIHVIEKKTKKQNHPQIFIDNAITIEQQNTIDSIWMEKTIKQILTKHQAKFDSIDTKKKFLDGIARDPFVVVHELTKLCLYNPIITDEAIDRLLSAQSDEDVYKLINHLLLGDIKKCLELYESLIIKKYQPSELIGILAGQLFNLKLMKQLADLGNSQAKIAQILNIPFWICKNQQILLTKVSLTQINFLFKDLVINDYNIKKGNTDNPYRQLKLFLIKHGK
ncbi:MAG: hypothetical protein LBC33_00025 [Mycoplasmataceae bacterium]|nr:hypothetical protein [Mycoplasmataceae bacterium]